MPKVLIVCSGNAPNFDFKVNQSFIYEQIESLKEYGVFYNTFFIKGQGLMGYLKNFKKFKEKINDYEPDIIHAHYGLSGLFANLQRKVPVITTYHGSDINIKKNRIFSYPASKLACENIFTHKDLPSKINYKDEKYIIPCGVDIKKFYPIDKIKTREILGLSQSHKYALFTSRFDNPVKNYELARKAITNISHEIKLIELINYTRQEVNLLLNAVDLLIVTSFSETGPLIVKEAMACNCPIVSVDVGDVSEVIKATDGCYISSYEVSDLCININKCLKFKGRTRGRHSIIKKYSTRVIANQVMNVYSKVF